jgi:Binding-protein-dependent transport system inner membrane component
VSVKSGEFHWATAALLVVVIWKYFGFHMALFVAGRQGIGDEVLEAAKIDGANLWQTTLNIILPLMRPVAVLSLFFSILGSLQAFAIIVALTDGGPSNSTNSVVSYLTRRSLRQCYAATVLLLAPSWCNPERIPTSEEPGKPLRNVCTPREKSRLSITFSTVGSSGKPSKNLSVPRRVLTESGVVTTIWEKLKASPD